MSDSSADARDGALVDALVQSSYVTMAVLSRVAADNELSLTQLRTLGILSDRRLAMAELADYLGLERSTLSGLIDRAERRGLVSRSPGTGDRRSVVVTVTPEGAALAERVHARVVRELGPLVGVLGIAERERLTALLRLALDEPRPDA
jgi:DNA-binding MarR family transcriptional regulator